MRRISTKSLREMLGVLLGAAIGAPIAFFLASNLEIGFNFNVAYLTVIFAIIGGTLWRGGLGWMLPGAMMGYVVADLLWSRSPKFNFGASGILPGAVIGLVVMVIVELFAPQKQIPPAEKG